ncbi:MAG: hypothetical protein HY718_01745 [Planctomycetes bacterium]|nr:hypothetical protein [Planctomycetota bacterium]
MHDNDFIATGSNLRDHQPDTLQIREEADRVTWSIKGRDFTGEPPIWRLSGSHAGVTTQLTYKALGPALWCWGPFARLSAGGRAGYEQLCTVEGTVQVDGKTYEIKNGYGVHERHEAAWTDTGDYMVDDIMGRGLYWQFGFSPEFSYYALTRERHPNFGYAVIDGEVYASTDPKKVQTEDVAFWDDPRTGFHVPYKWHTWMQTDDGIMDVHYTAYARACNVWVRPKGYCIYYWFLCRGSGSFRFADGRVVQSDNMMCLQNIDRTFLNLAHIGAYPGR